MIWEVRRDAVEGGGETVKIRKAVNPSVASVESGLQEKQVIGFFCFKMIIVFIMSQCPPRDLAIVYVSVYLFTWDLKRMYVYFPRFVLH